MRITSARVMVLCMIVVNSVLAQSDVQLETITVTGELQERDLQESQTSAAIITGEELDVSTDAELYDVIDRTPNVSKSFGEKGFAIRGIDQRGVGAGSGLLLNVTVDGATLPSNQATFFGPYSTWDLQQVEVLRGPQSTQQGRNALAGAINIRSQDPTFEPETKLRFDVGQLDSTRAALAFNAPLVEDRIALRIAGEQYSSDGWVANPTRDEDNYDARQLKMLRSKLLVQPTEALRALFTYSITDNSGGEDYVQAALFPEQRINPSDARSEEGSLHRISNLRLDYTFNSNWSLRSETSYYDQDYVRREDTDFSAQPGNLINRNATDTSLSQEFRLRYQGNRLRGTMGVYFTDIDSEDDTVATVPGTLLSLPASTRVDVIFDNDTNTQNIATFAEFDYQLTTRWTLTAGGRYDTVDRTQRTIIPPVVDIPQPPPVTTDNTFNAFLPKLGIKYDWNADLSTGFTVQRGYRAGGSQRNLFTGQLNDFDPEYTWNYEFALRSSWLDKRLTANANLFFTQWTEQQVNSLGDTGNPNDINVVNAGESELYGFELETRALLTESLDVFAGLGYVHTEFTDFVDGGENFAGNEFPNAPQLSASLGGSYYFDSGWAVHLNGSFTDESFSDTQNTEFTKADDYWLVNARLGYEAEGWSVYLYARNALDEDYRTQITNDGTLYRTGEPRVVGVQLNAWF